MRRGEVAARLHRDQRLPQPALHVGDAPRAQPAGGVDRLSFEVRRQRLSPAARRLESLGLELRQLALGGDRQGRECLPQGIVLVPQPGDDLIDRSFRDPRPVVRRGCHEGERPARQSRLQMQGLAHDTEPASHIQGAAAAGAHLEIGEPGQFAQHPPLYRVCDGRRSCQHLEVAEADAGRAMGPQDDPPQNRQRPDPHAPRGPFEPGRGVEGGEQRFSELARVGPAVRRRPGNSFLEHHP